MYSQHALAAEDVLGLFRQQVSHKHVEAVLIQRATRDDAHTAHITQVVELLAAALGAPLPLCASAKGGHMGGAQLQCASVAHGGGGHRSSAAVSEAHRPTNSLIMDMPGTSDTALFPAVPKLPHAPWCRRPHCRHRCSQHAGQLARRQGPQSDSSAAMTQPDQLTAAALHHWHMQIHPLHLAAAAALLHHLPQAPLVAVPAWPRTP